MPASTVAEIGASRNRPRGVCEIGARHIWRRVAAVADRRVIRDDLLLNKACSVQAGNRR